MTHEADRPLAGWRVVVTRAPQQATSLNAALTAAGAEPVPYPTIDVAPAPDPLALQYAVAALQAGTYDWLILTSRAGVATLADALQAAPLPPQTRLAVVGSSTAAAAQTRLGRVPDVLPETFTGAALAAALGQQPGQRVLLAQGNLAPPTVRDALQAGGAQVHAVVAYATVIGRGGADVPAMLGSEQLDAITFTSGSTVENFLTRVGGAALLPRIRQHVIACIGPVTAAVAAAHGLPPAVVAEPSTVAGLVAGMATLRRQQATT